MQVDVPPGRADGEFVAGEGQYRLDEVRMVRGDGDTRLQQRGELVAMVGQGGGHPFVGETDHPAGRRGQMQDSARVRDAHRRAGQAGAAQSDSDRCPRVTELDLADDVVDRCALAQGDYDGAVPAALGGARDRVQGALQPFERRLRPLLRGDAHRLELVLRCETQRLCQLAHITVVAVDRTREGLEEPVSHPRADGLFASGRVGVPDGDRAGGGVDEIPHHAARTQQVGCRLGGRGHHRVPQFAGRDVVRLDDVGQWQPLHGPAPAELTRTLEDVVGERFALREGAQRRRELATDVSALLVDRNGSVRLQLGADLTHRPVGYRVDLLRDLSAQPLDRVFTHGLGHPLSRFPHSREIHEPPRRFPGFAHGPKGVIQTTLVPECTSTGTGPNPRRRWTQSE
nr:hypothetical protein JVH1_4782 [Rhodococcus sp. JVH1]